MPPQLLPASAAAFAPRAASVNVVLGTEKPTWLTQTLKRVNRVKRPLNSVMQHQRCLTELLSHENALWTLTSIMLPKAPESELRQDENQLVEALFNYQLLHIEAYIVHVDMVLRNEVAFKLTKESIETLIEYHKGVYCVDAKASTHEWTEKDQQAKKLHEDFVQAVNKFVYRTNVIALEGLEEEGTGELLCGKSDEVKTQLLGLMKPLLPPPPRVVDVIRQPTLLPSSPASGSFWSQPTTPSSIPAPVDSWRVLPSSPNVVSTGAEHMPLWATMGLSEAQMSPPTPTYSSPAYSSPTYSQPFSSGGYYYSSPMVTAPIPSLPPLPLPSMLAQQCGAGVGYGGFGWDRYSEYQTTM